MTAYCQRRLRWFMRARPARLSSVAAAGSGTLAEGGVPLFQLLRTMSRSSSPTKPSPEGSPSASPGVTFWFQVVKDDIQVVQTDVTIAVQIAFDRATKYGADQLQG